MDKSITFHECIIICDMLQHIKLHFLQRQHKLYLIFCVSNFLKVWKFADFSERPQAKSVSASGDFTPCPPYQRLCPWIPLGALPPDPHYTGLTLVFGGASNSLAPTLGDAMANARSPCDETVRGTAMVLDSADPSPVRLCAAADGLMSSIHEIVKTSHPPFFTGRKLHPPIIGIEATG